MEKHPRKNKYLWSEGKNGNGSKRPSQLVNRLCLCVRVTIAGKSLGLALPYGLRTDPGEIDDVVSVL